jgi:uncharacterized membrane protein YsdA (DUF1294 family)
LPRNARRKATPFASPAFAIAFAAAALLWVAPLWLALVYLAASVVTFIAYARDKSAAVRGGWRTRESTLHMLGLAGGWPGALLAQQILRHKSSKAGFRSAFWFTVIVNVAVFLFACSPQGRALLASA